jgi:hypothetical protein
MIRMRMDRRKADLVGQIKDGAVLIAIPVVAILLTYLFLGSENDVLGAVAGIIAVLVYSFGFISLAIGVLLVLAGVFVMLKNWYLSRKTNA